VDKIRLNNGNLKNIFNYILLICFTSIAIMPLLWMVITSIKPYAEVLRYPPNIIPSTINLGGFKHVLFESKIPRAFINSSIISFITTIFSLLLAIFGAYGFSRFKFFGSNFFLFSTLLGQMIPRVVLLVPLYILLLKFKLIDTYPGLIFSYLAFTLPLSVWFLKTYFEGISRDIDDAALIDGCSHIQVLFRIIIPISRPAIFTTAAYAFLNAWKEYVLALNLSTTITTRTLPIELEMWKGLDIINWVELMSATVIVCIPAIFIFIIFGKYLVSDIMSGSMKG